MPQLIHFDISADEPERAKKFYEQVFGWKIEKSGGPVEYWLIDTSEPGKPGVGGGLEKRENPSDSITNFIDVPSADAFAAKIEASGGRIVRPKMTIPGVGYIVACKDTEGNTFGIIEHDESARP